MSNMLSVFGTPREWAKDLTVAAAIGVFLGVIGPFGSYYGGPMELRILYWVANLLIGFVVMALTVRLSMKLARRLDLPAWFTLAVSVAIGALPLGLLVGWFAVWFWPGSHGRMGSLMVQYVNTLAISEPCAFGYYFLLDGHWRPAPARSSEAAPAPMPAPAPPAAEAGRRFLDRLPPRLGRDLLCLQMEDHYVRAHTPKGSDLVLTSLKDAVAELAQADGLQVHRSWWVARRAVVEPLFRGRNLSLRLSNGLEAPVSRAAVARLRAAGWLEMVDANDLSG